jgi:outer membrane protein OmpA-like peptidoglycan-associated protein
VTKFPRFLTVGSFFFALFLIGSVSRDACAFVSQQLPVDSIAYKDTLIETMMRVTHKPLKAGAAVSYGPNFLQLQSLNLPADPITTNCDFFTTGSGSSFGIDVRTDMPLWGDLSPWSFVPRLAFEQIKGDLLWTQQVPTWDSTNQIIRNADFRHRLSALINVISFKGLIAFEFLHTATLEIGPVLGYQFNQTFARRTETTAPGDRIDGQSSRLDASGDLVGSNRFTLGFAVSLGAEFPISAKLHARPYVDISAPITRVASYLRAESLRLGLAFLYDLTSSGEMLPVYEKRQIPIVIKRDTTAVVKNTIPHLSASIRAVGVERDGTESNIVTISIQEIKSRNAYPTLNLIFFDSGSATLPERYVQYRNAQDASSRYAGSDERNNIPLLDLYHETINIIGDRLKKYSKAQLTLIGSTSNNGIETGNLALAKARADELKNYFVKVWSIDPKRIQTQGRLLPEHPSPVDSVLGQQENRRVEMLVSDERITDPIVVTNTEHLATPPNIQLIPTIHSKYGIRHIRAAIIGGGRELLSLDGDAPAHKLLNLNEDILSQLSDSLRLLLEVTDSNGESVTATNSIPLVINRIARDRTEGLDRFSLILFGFDRSSIEGKNERLLGNIARALPALNPERVTIVGYTDEMGDPQHNEQLSQERASEARVALENYMRALKLPLPGSILTEGRGAKDRLYDNTLPEGRFFSRTVNITIERALH